MPRHIESGDIELVELLSTDEQQKQRSMKRSQYVGIANGIIDQLGLAAIFLTKASFTAFLENTGKYIFFPAAAAGSIIQAIVSIRQAQLSGGKTNRVVKAVVDVIAAAAITTAVVGALAASVIFGAISPIIFTATLGAKTLYHAGAAFFYWGKSAATTIPYKKSEYRHEAKQQGIQALSLAISTAAVATVMVFGKVAAAGLGIANGIMTAIYLGYRGYKLYKDKKAGYQPLPAEEPKSENDEAENEVVNRPKLKRSLSSPAMIHSLVGHQGKKTTTSQAPVSTVETDIENVIPALANKPVVNEPAPHRSLRAS